MHALTINPTTSPRSVAIVDLRVSDSRLERGLARAHHVAHCAVNYYANAPLNPRALIIGIKTAKSKSAIKAGRIVSRTRAWSRVA